MKREIKKEVVLLNSLRTKRDYMNIKFSPPDISEEEIKEVVETLKSGWITTGPRTKEFENEISKYCGTNKTVCLNSATAGLELILRVWGIGEGDEVITSAYTYTASASVIQHVGAKIVLCDTKKDSVEMDYTRLESLITRKTKAIIAVDIAGVIADYSRIFEIVEKNKSKFQGKTELQNNLGRVLVIADAAHSFGARHGELRSGAIADFTSFSFHAVKNLTTAEGGAVTWRRLDGVDDNALDKTFMLLSLHGQNKDALEKTNSTSWEYDIVTLGYKCNMTDIMSAIGLVQLQRYDNMLKRREYIYDYYRRHLESEEVTFLKHSGCDFKSSYHLCVVRFKSFNESKRNEFILKLSERGIPLNVHYKPLPMFTAYKELGFNILDFPNSYNLYEKSLTLPLHTMLTDEEIKYIVKEIKKYVKY